MENVQANEFRFGLKLGTFQLQGPGTHNSIGNFFPELRKTQRGCILQTTFGARYFLGKLAINSVIFKDTLVTVGFNNEHVNGLGRFIIISLSI